VLFALERFDSYIYGKSDVTVETDHSPLLAIKKKTLTSAPKRLQRMLLRTQRYTFSLAFVRGKEMHVADMLSRASFPQSAGPPTSSEFSEELASLCDTEPMDDLRLVASEKTIKLIQHAAVNDKQYALLKRQISSGWPDTPTGVPAEIREYYMHADELIVSHDLVFKGQRVVVPIDAREVMLERLHSSHIGMNSCIRRAREAVFWPGITADI